VAGVILGATLTSSSSQNNGPPAPPATLCGSSAPGGGATYVCMNKNRGYPDTSFVVEGRGFSPRTTLKVKVSEVDPVNNEVFSEISADMPVTSSGGMFQAPVAELYHGSLQLGLVTVSVTGPGGHSSSTQFMVIPPGAPLNGRPPG
jgi:hypothetical protein